MHATMISSRYFYCILSLSMLIICINGKKMSFKSPVLSDEESSSVHMPEHLNCDSCVAVAYQMKMYFDKASRNQKNKLSESEVIDVMDEVCMKDFSEYGVKAVNGQNRISGPGTETDSVPGMIQMGGRWPKRLQDICNYYVGELEEVPIYEAYLEHEGNLVEFLCRGEERLGSCKRFKEEL